MKPSLLFLLASTLALSASAQTNAGNDPVTIVGQKAALAPYRMAADDFKPYKGYYTLSNGLELGLTSWGRRMYAQVGDQPVHEIVAVGEDRFAARDGKMDMHIVLSDNGRDASGELNYVDERGGALPTVAGADKWVRVAFR
jgi:hypothetical protein